LQADQAAIREVLQAANDALGVQRATELIRRRGPYAAAGAGGRVKGGGVPVKGGGVPGQGTYGVRPLKPGESTREKRVQPKLGGW